MPRRDPDSNGVIPPDCRCETCKLARFEGSEIRRAVVHAYSYRPRNWRLCKVASDPIDYYLGVELECDNFDASGGSRIYSQFSNEQAADMRRPKNLWMAKRDGSVSGPEFVSHPATLTYWKKQETAIRKMFKMLVHAGFRSHDNDNAGMHINISKNAFADSAHLFRFLTLIHGNADWSLKMSQRSSSSAEQWASLSYLADENRRQSEVERIMPDPALPRYPWNRPTSSHRYQAINCPSDGRRFEFRLPRGTFRFDRFMKNLEWTQAMIEFSRRGDGPVAGYLHNMNSKTFMQWVAETQAGTYPNLLKFMRERFPSAFGGTQTAWATPSVSTNNEGVRISPRTGRPMRAYNRREGAVRPPGRPVGYSPVRGNVTAREISTNYQDECSARSDGGLYCEYVIGHPGLHGAPSVNIPDFAVVRGPDFHYAQSF